MDKSGKIYKTYVQTLKEELIPAMGCTEPIAIAYAAAKAREVLGCDPDLVKIGVSNNIIKNVKSVVVPNTDGMKGIGRAAHEFDLWVGLPVRDVHGQAVFGQGDFIDVEA